MIKLISIKTSAAVDILLLAWLAFDGTFGVDAKSIFVLPLRKMPITDSFY